MTKEKGLIIGSILMVIGISIGAFGAHGLKDILEENGTLSTFQTGVEYLFYNSIGILIISLSGKDNKMKSFAIISIILGIILFSFSLFTLSITGIKALGIITPFGGLSMIIGWILFIMSLKTNKN